MTDDPRVYTPRLFLNSSIVAEMSQRFITESSTDDDDTSFFITEDSPDGGAHSFLLQE